MTLRRCRDHAAPSKDVHNMRENWKLYGNCAKKRFVTTFAETSTYVR